MTKRNVFTASKPKGRQAGSRTIQSIMAVAAEYWECIALREKQLIDHALEPILQKVEVDNARSWRTLPLAAAHSSATGTNGNPWQQGAVR
jgi:hypothetical protein